MTLIKYTTTDTESFSQSKRITTGAQCWQNQNILGGNNMEYALRCQPSTKIDNK